MYEVRPRKDKRGVDLISDALPFGRLLAGGCWAKPPQILLEECWPNRVERPAMKPLFVTLLILLACAYLCGCADVQERSHIVGGRTGTPLTASVGDTVLRVAREKNLPNIAGKADIFGALPLLELRPSNTKA